MKSGEMVSILGALGAASAVCMFLLALAIGPGGCGAKQRTQLQLKHFLITVDNTVQLTVICDGQAAYTLPVWPGMELEIGGPEALCAFTTDEPVKLEAKAIWRE